MSLFSWFGFFKNIELSCDLTPLASPFSFSGTLLAMVTLNKLLGIDTVERVGHRLLWLGIRLMFWGLCHSKQTSSVESRWGSTVSSFYSPRAFPYPSPLTLAGPPRMADKVVPRQVARLGRTVRLQCPVEGDPPPLTMWTKDGRTIHSGWSRFRVLPQGLKVKEVEAEDAGVYVCKATNGFGSLSVNYTLIIMGQLVFKSEITVGPKLAGRKVCSRHT